MVLIARGLLQDMDQETVPVTSGSKGLHIYAALDGRASSEEISGMAHDLAQQMESEHPDLVVSKISESLRGGKVFVDGSHNNANRTTEAHYSLRGKPKP